MVTVCWWCWTVGEKTEHLYSAVWLQTGATSALSYLMTLSFQISQIRCTCQLFPQIVGVGPTWRPNVATPSLGWSGIVNTGTLLPVITPSTVRHALAAADSLHVCGWWRWWLEGADLTDRVRVTRVNKSNQIKSSSFADANADQRNRLMCDWAPGCAHAGSRSHHRCTTARRGRARCQSAVHARRCLPVVSFTRSSRANYRTRARTHKCGLFNRWSSSINHTNNFTCL